MFLFRFPADVLSRKLTFKKTGSMLRSNMLIHEWDVCRVGAMLVHIRPGEFGHVWTLLGTFHINIEIRAGIG